MVRLNNQKRKHLCFLSSLLLILLGGSIAEGSTVTKYSDSEGTATAYTATGIDITICHEPFGTSGFSYYQNCTAPHINYVSATINSSWEFYWLDSFKKTNSQTVYSNMKTLLVHYNTLYADSGLRLAFGDVNPHLKYLRAYVENTKQAIVWRIHAAQAVISYYDGAITYNQMNQNVQEYLKNADAHLNAATVNLRTYEKNLAPTR